MKNSKISKGVFKMKTKKILTMIMALVMMLTLAIPMTAFAADAASITVNAPDSLVVSADKFFAYKLFDVTVSMNPAGTEKNYAYTPVDELDDFLTAHPTYGADTDAFKTFLEDGPSVSEMKALTKDLMDFGFTPIPAAQNGTGSVKFTLSDYGYYLVTGEGTPVKDGDNVIAHCTLVTVDKLDPDAIVNLKADAPFIDKEVWNHNLDGGKGDWDEWTDINMGTDAQFKLTSRVPVFSVGENEEGNPLYKGYESYIFTVHDTMSEGLTFNNDVKVYIGGSPIPLGSSYYNVDTDPDDSCTFEIVFDPDLFITLGEGASIEITYSAELNEYAVIGAPGNPNAVYLEYSNNPYTTSAGNPGDDTGETPEVEVIVYTFDLEIYKYTGELGDDDYALADAEFELRDADDSAVRVVEIDADGKILVPEYDADGRVTNHSGKYRLATSADNTTDITTVLVSADDGMIYIKGLDAGDYVLEETKAPKGFNLLAGWKTVVIIHENADGEYSMTVDGDPTNTVNVQNNTGPEFPGTGGTGMTLIIIGGLALIVFGVGAIVIYKKRRTLSALKAK